MSDPQRFERVRLHLSGVLKSAEIDRKIGRDLGFNDVDCAPLA
jgi:hypothetical protein